MMRCARCLAVLPVEGLVPQEVAGVVVCGQLSCVHAALSGEVIAAESADEVPS